MCKKHDVVKEFPGLVVIHQKIPSYEVGEHNHDQHEFFLPLHGEVTIRHDDHEVKAGPGRMLYVPPKIEHQFTSSSKGAGERVIWLIEDHLWKKHVEDIFPVLAMPSNSLAKELLFYLLIQENTPGEKYFISALVASLGDSLQGAITKERHLASAHIAARAKDPRLKKAMELIKNSEGQCSLSDIAKTSGQSTRTLSRLFLKEIGIAPGEFLVFQRIERAKELLSTTEMTVTDIALEVGYNSLSKFIAAFKRTEGLLPSDYRRQKFMVK